MKKDETEYLSEGENGKRLKESISQLKKSEMEEQERDNELQRLLIIYNYLEGQKSEISDKIESLMGTELLTKKQKWNGGSNTNTSINSGIINRYVSC